MGEEHLVKVNMAVMLAATSAILFGLSNICYKLGIPPLDEFTVRKVTSLDFIAPLITSKWVIAGVVLTVISGLFYIAALSQGEVVRVVAVLSLSYIVTAVMAFFFLGETLNTFRIGGFALIMVGIVLIHTGT
jgi:uncharacterized membrane protein